MDEDGSPQVKLPASLEDARILYLPPSSYYIPNFITPEEEECLLRKVHNPYPAPTAFRLTLPSSLQQINTAPLPRWTQLTHRRLQTYPSSLSKENVLLHSALPSWLTDPILPRFGALGIFSTTPHRAPNHVLINEYHPSQGIMPHEDGPAYAPIVATVSLGAAIVLDVYKKKDNGEREAEASWRVLQERRSLLVSIEGMYKDVLHGIGDKGFDECVGEVANWELIGDKEAFGEGRNERGVRVSLTYRDVLKVAKLGGGLKFLKK
jgi:alkylated DNA repair protein alkB homolog 6